METALLITKSFIFVEFVKFDDDKYLARNLVIRKNQVSYVLVEIVN